MGLMPAESSTEQLGHRELVWLVIGIGLAVLPHCTRLPVWIPLLHYCLTLLRLIIPNLELSQIYNTTFILIRQLVMVAALFGVYGSYGTLVGRDAGIALLVVLSGFKVLESKESRDFYIACFLGYFLIITNFIYTQSIPTAIFMFAVIVIMTVSLITYNDSGKQLLITSRLRLSGALLFQALPIMLILFLLFPRVTGPLWGLPKDAHTGQTGIDDEMAPGSISQLIQSNAVAFRAKFLGQIPKPAQLYWRGPVLWFSDGHKWTAGRKKYGRSPAPINTFGQPVRYEITLEPTNKYWLFALEIPTYIPEQSYLTYDLQLKTKLPVRVRKQYTLVSYTNFLIGTGHPAELQRALQLPEGHHNKTIQLARAWRQESNSPGEIIGRALHWFKNDNFYYTQTPPPLHRDSVDEFLFSTKQGFCEHYAMAFVVLMRAAGIPARVVTGYQGGEFNPVGNYLIVRQRDAHAWAEVWLGKEGWQRVDPTAAVSPARIDQGIDNALPNSIFDIPLGLESSIIARDLWQRFQNTWDAINYQWNQWILSYGPKRQTQFLSQFGLGRPDWRGMTMGLMVMVGLIIVCMAIWLFRQQPLATDPARRAYEQFCNKLARQGMVRGMSEGPVDFAQRSSTRRADLAREINRITTLYIEIRYGSQTDRLKSLKYLIRKFDTGRRQ
jgi:transglutaminase-like putative cysteine protease